MLTFLVSRRLISDLSIRRSDSFLAERQKGAGIVNQRRMGDMGEKGLNSGRRTEEGPEQERDTGLESSRDFDFQEHRDVT